MYRALRPFIIGDQHVGVGALIEDTIEASPNFDSLYRNGFIENADIDIKRKSEYVGGFFVVTTGFMDNGRRWKPGDIVNSATITWKNIDKMLQTGYLRRATKEDLKETQYDIEQASGTSGAYAQPWKNKEWLKQKYIEEGLSMAEIAKEAGCAISTLAKWMKKMGVQSRKPGKGGRK